MHKKNAIDHALVLCNCLNGLKLVGLHTHYPFAVCFWHVPIVFVRIREMDGWIKKNPYAISVSVMDSSREYFVLDKFLNISCSFFSGLSQAIKNNSFTLTNVFICRCQPVLSGIPSTDFLGDRTKQIDDDKRRLLTQKSRATYGCTKTMFEVFSLIVRGLVSSKLVQ